MDMEGTEEWRQKTEETRVRPTDAQPKETYLSNLVLQ